ncbi:AHH domain-containing protein [Pyxidicoccus trucidator]|uniref:AHH domain-containing protein n=1 Tax=Pyxidicoccus trucidator TaxID=2709662 RepID=UPI0013DC56A7|nr:AHH domain-containing protein [Pyxidicoccus trucidator]
MPLKRGWTVLLLALLGTGCATARVVHLDTGEGPPRAHVSRTDVKPGVLEEADFEDAVRRMAGTVPVGARPRDVALGLFARPGAGADVRVRGRLGLVSVEEPGRGRLSLSEPAEEGTELERAYGRWCQRRQQAEDCLYLLDEGVTLDEEGRRTLAFRLGLDAVWDETAEALEELTDREAVVTMLVTTGAFYLGLWLVPEPLLSKGIAATLTVALIGYLGWDTVWSLVRGWRVLAAEVKEATTFDELRRAGEKYGEVMGKNAARAFVMLAMAAMGGTAELMAARVATLPGSGQAALVAAAQGGIRLGAAARVEAVVISATGEVTIALAPGAVAMTAQGAGGASAAVVAAGGPEHHIATNKNSESDVRGGPWTPRFQEIFDRAGMSLDDAANRVHVPGHKGPHPREYHEEVFNRLDRVTARCRTLEHCRKALTAELMRLAREISSQGSRLNELVTRSE